MPPKRRKGRPETINQTHYNGGNRERRRSNQLRVFWRNRNGRDQVTPLVRALRGQQPGDSRLRTRNSNVAYIPIPGTQLNPRWIFMRHNPGEHQHIRHGLRSGSVNHIHRHPRGTHISAYNTSQQRAMWNNNSRVRDPRQRIGRTRARYSYQNGENMYYNGVNGRTLNEQNRFLTAFEQAYQRALQEDRTRQRQIHTVDRAKRKMKRALPKAIKKAKQNKTMKSIVQFLQDQVTEKKRMNEYKKRKNGSPNNPNMRRAIMT